MENTPEELDQGLSALEQLVRSVRAQCEWNEAETRIHFIDRLISDCLGWPRTWFKLEKHMHDGYADYVLGQPNLFVVEAKRIGQYFEIPVSPRSSCFPVP